MSIARLTTLLQAGARAAHLNETVQEGEEEGSLEWDGITFTPGEVEYEIHSLRGKETRTAPGWILSYVKTFHATRWEPEDYELVEFARCPSEQAAAMRAILFVLEDGIGNAIADAAESLHYQEEHNREERH